MSKKTNPIDGAPVSYKYCDLCICTPYLTQVVIVHQISNSKLLAPSLHAFFHAYMHMYCNCNFCWLFRNLKI